MNIPNKLKNIINYLAKNGAKAIIVGGAVRDYLMKQSIKDWDIEVYNIDTLDRLEELLKPFGKVNQVGKSYGIIKLTIDNNEIDFSLPRVDTKVDKGHKGFNVEVTPNLNFKEAAKRRDFTINSIGYDSIQNKFLDPFNGIKDIKNRVLRVIDKDSFTQDPLRVYRAIGFSARFNLNIDSNSFTLLKRMVENNSLNELPKERVFIEFKKLLLKSNKPSIGFEIMRKLGIIKKYFNELNNTKNWQDMLNSLDIMVSLLKDSKLDEESRLILIFAILCCNLSQDDAKRLITKLTNQKKIIDSILVLIEYYLTPFDYFTKGVNSVTIKELSTKVNIDKLLYLSKAYYLGYYKKSKCDACNWLEKKAKELNVLNAPPKAIIEGKDLIKLGFKPSKEFKYILENLYRMQLNEEFKTKEEAYNILAKS